MSDALLFFLGACLLASWAFVAYCVLRAYVHGLPTPPPQDEDEGW